MCNYLNKYTNLNDADYIRYTSLYEMCTKNVFLICLVYFQNCEAIKKNKKGFKAYPCPNILIPLAKWTIYASILK